ncbi:hypothetical protein ACFQZE_19195 [Paenibacillus sp. GCM10027627]|uniref:hypothetical protein n=1 Tax=unclassified Paenibacillus TaxID=185978 RepID=UPI003628C639
MEKRIEISLFNKAMGAKKGLALFLALVISVVMLPVTASAAYHNTYADVATLGTIEGANITQGFDTGSTYAYSIKVNKPNTKAVIYRTHMDNGTTTVMKNNDGGVLKDYVTYLSHANDLVLATINGEFYMFVVTMESGSLSLVKFHYVGTTYTKVGNYSIQLNGANKAMSGVEIIGKDASNLTFLFKTGKNFYRGTLPLTANSGSIALTADFSINVADAKVNGDIVADLDNPSVFAHQGFGYHNNKIYVPLTLKEGNVSIVLVYSNITSASGIITSENDLSFRITSSTYSDLFEIEGVGIGSGGKLYFNTNRRINSTDTTHDGVHYFKTYVAS